MLCFASQIINCIWIWIWAIFLWDWKLCVIALIFFKKWVFLVLGFQFCFLSPILACTYPSFKSRWIISLITAWLNTYYRRCYSTCNILQCFPSTEQSLIHSKFINPCATSLEIHQGRLTIMCKQLKWLRHLKFYVQLNPDK